MKLIDLTCPGCGAVIKVNSELSRGLCNFCGKEFLVDDEVQRMEIVNGKELGFQQEQGRQEAVEKNRTDLLKDLQEALHVQKEYDDLSSLLKKKKRSYNQKLNSKGTELAIVFVCLAIVIFWGTFVVAGMPGDDMMMKSLVYIVLLIPMSIIAVVVIKNEQKKKVQSCSHMQEEIKDLETKLGETEKTYEEKIAIIPEDYRNASAIESFCTYINNRRADDLRQAMNLYEEELHRKRVEDTQMAILMESQKQTNIQMREAQKHH